MPSRSRAVVPSTPIRSHLSDELDDRATLRALVVAIDAIEQHARTSTWSAPASASDAALADPFTGALMRIVVERDVPRVVWSEGSLRLDGLED